MEAAVERGLDWAGLPVIGAMAQPPGGVQRSIRAPECPHGGLTGPRHLQAASPGQIDTRSRLLYTSREAADRAALSALVRMPNVPSEHRAPQRARAGRQIPAGPRVWLALWGPPLAWMAFIFFLSAQPRPDAVVPIAFEGGDVVAHLALYAALGVLLWRAAYRGGGELLERRPGRWALAMGCSYAASDEIHQALVPIRSPQLTDVAIDSVGVVFGIALGWLAFRRRVRRRHAGDER